MTGIMAPTQSQIITLATTAIVSHQRPMILCLMGLITFLILTRFLKNLFFSFLLALLMVCLVAMYFVISFLNSVRF